MCKPLKFQAEDQQAGLAKRLDAEGLRELLLPRGLRTKGKKEESDQRKRELEFGCG